MYKNPGKPRPLPLPRLPLPMHLIMTHEIMIKWQPYKQRFKGRVRCFLMQVIMNKCFLLNPEINLAQIRLVVFEKNAKKRTSLFKKMTSPSRRLGYSNNQLKC